MARRPKAEVPTTRLLALTAVVLASAADPVVAESAASDNSLIESLTQQKTVAELRQAIAEAEKAALLAALPASDAKGAAGDVSLSDQAGYFGELIAHASVAEAARAIVQRLTALDQSQPIIVTHETDLGAKFLRWRLIMDRLDGYKSAFENISGRLPNSNGKQVKRTADVSEQTNGDGNGFGTAASLIAIPPVLGGLAEIASFFKSDLSIQHREVQIENRQLLAEVASQLVPKYEVVLPELNQEPAPGISSKLVEVEDVREKLRTTLIGVTADSVTSTKLRGDFLSLSTAYETYRNAITQDAGNNPAPLFTLALVDQINARESAQRLHLEIVSIGSEMHVEKRPLRPTRISYIGGSVCLYVHFGADDKVLGSGTVQVWQARSFRPRRSDTLTGYDAHAWKTYPP